MLQYCPCITQFRHINHYIELRELLHLKAHMRQRGEGMTEKGVVEGGDRGLDKRRMHGECQEIRPSDSSEPSVQRSAGALKLKPLPEHNSWRGLLEVDNSSQTGYWPLWTLLQYLGQLTCPCFKFLFCCQRNNSVPIHAASWTQHEVWKCELCVSLAYRKRLSTGLVLFLFSTFGQTTSLIYSLAY